MKLKSLIAFLFLFLCPTLFAQGTKVNGNNQINWPGPKPWIDITSYGAVSGIQSATATCIASSGTINLSTAADFKNGQYVNIPGCGATATVTSPTFGILQMGTPGSTSYTYTVACTDAAGGWSPYNTPITSTTGNATLSATNQNLIWVNPGLGCQGYELFKNIASRETAIEYLPADPFTTVYSGMTVTRTSNVLTITVPNGLFYWSEVATLSNCGDATVNGSVQIVTIPTLNTFTANQTGANTSTTCSVVQDITFFDWGNTAWPFPAYVSTFGGATAYPDTYIGRITAGGGTSSVTVTPVVTNSNSGILMSHDNTTAINAAIAAAIATPGSLFIPSGHYVFAGQLTAIPPNFQIKGENWANTELSQQTTGLDIFAGGTVTNIDSTQDIISDLTLSGGRFCLHDSPVAGMGILRMDNIFFQCTEGIRFDGTLIQGLITNFYCQTSDWCMDSSPILMQGLKFQTGWMGGTGQGVWHDFRFPANTAQSIGLEFDNILWEGPSYNFMVGSATIVGARQIICSASALTFKAAYVADNNINAAATTPWLQNCGNPNGTPFAIDLEDSYIGADAGTSALNFLSTGGSNSNITVRGGQISGGGSLSPIGGSYNGIVSINSSLINQTQDYRLTSILGGTTSVGLFATTTNCSSSASPAACVSMPAGSVTVAAGQTTEIVDTTAVTANSQIQLTFDSSLGTKLSVTCNTTPVQGTVSARTTGVSFTITVPSAPSTNPACFNYNIIN